MTTPIQIRGPVKSAIIASGLVANSMFVYVFTDAISAGAFEGTDRLVTWIHLHWLQTVASFIYGATVSSRYRVNQEQNRIAHTVVFDNGAEATILPPKKEGPPI
jgi:hypothetical protein